MRVAIRRLHAAGIEVILDVVYNHTAEGNELGPTLSFRGFDNSSYYRLVADNPRHCINDTGTGNTLNLSHPRVLQMVMDSLRYWVTNFHVDGFRFDLGVTLGRESYGFDPGSGFFDALRQDPILARAKLISEPWDVGPGGYQLGHHPPGFAEWNDRYRDGIRRHWRSDNGMRGEFAARLAGSSDLFDRRSRRPWASVNYAASHDGFTLADVASYAHRHNDANGEENRDGQGENYSANWGVEGPTDDPKIKETRGRVLRGLLATVFLSHGTPMLLAGDEFGHTQRGNNNAYCQDNEISWLDWKQAATPEAQALFAFRRSADPDSPREPCTALPTLPARQRRTRPWHSRHRLVRYARRAHRAGLLEQSGETLVRSAARLEERRRNRSNPHVVSKSERPGPRVSVADPKRADATAYRHGAAGYGRTGPQRRGDQGRGAQRGPDKERASTVKDMSHFVRDLPFGATLLEKNRTRFRLWAPQQAQMSVEIGERERIPMQRREGGWFEVAAACGAGASYRYVLDSGLRVPDPAARAQARDVHDASVVIDPRAYHWRCSDWRGRPWPEAVLYELHAGLCGGFAGVACELDRLSELGITAIELMPINDFPGERNWGYDGVLPFAPDRAYGSPDDLKALIDAAHARGLMVLLDVVYNHFGPDGNYLASYAPQFFRQDVATPWGPAIDFRHAEVRQFFTENALYWLMEYRVDGLRLDAVHAITELDWLDEMAAKVRATAEQGRHVHLVLEHDGNVAEHLRRDFDAQWNDDGHHALHVLLTGENESYYVDYADKPAERLARALAEGFVYQGEPSAHRNGAPRGTPSADLPPTAFVLFLQNHDQIGNRAFGDRLTVHTGASALEAAIALQLLCPQIPLVFMGEENACKTPFQFFTDHHGDLAEAVREGRRREFAGFAAFSDPARREQIPDPNAAETFANSRLRPGPEANTRRALYHELIALRAEHLVPRLKGARAISAKAIGPLAVIARWRLGDGTTWTLASNLGAQRCGLSRPAGQAIFGAPRAGYLDQHTTLCFLESSHG
jgi:isoamylase